MLLEYDDCDGTDCYGLFCVDKVSDYLCVCDPAYNFTGPDCGIELMPCDFHYCYRGSCSVNGYGDAYCDCDEGWNGTYCENG